jgi:uncharacterized membrane protein
VAQHLDSRALSSDGSVSVRDWIRIASPGHLAFTVTLIALGIAGFVTRDFSQMWQPVPKWVPGRTALVFLCAMISLGTGIGIAVRRWALAASRVLLIALLIWLVVLRLPNLFYEHPVVLVGWTFGSTAVMVAAAWVLYIWFAHEHDSAHPGFLADATGLRIARTLYGLSMIPFGLAHFMYLGATTVLIPDWLPGHVALAYFTGAAFVAAGLAVCVGVLAYPAAALSALQMGLFTLIVWVPRMLTGNVTEFQRGEFVSSCALTAGAWVVAESYRERRRSAGRIAIA